MQIITNAAVAAGLLAALAAPASAKVLRLTDTQLDRVTAGGSVNVGANGSGGFTIDMTTALGVNSAFVGYGVSVSFGLKPQANVTVGGIGTVFNQVISGGTGPIRFSVGVVSAL